MAPARQNKLLKHQVVILSDSLREKGNGKKKTFRKKDQLIELVDRTAMKN